MSGSTCSTMDDRSSGALAEWLFGDIGGTNARFARWRRSEGVGAIRRSRGDEFADLAQAVREFERDQPDPACHAALAIAVRVRDAPLQMTNRPWSIDARALRGELGLEVLHLVNDFVAAAAGLPALGDGDSHLVRQGAPASDHFLLIGPGTGLGAAALLDAGQATERVVASEAGHMGFGYHDPALAPLLEAGRRRWSRLSWERVLNGEGLSFVYAWQAGQDAAAGDDPHATGWPLRAVPARDVSARAAAGEPAACRAVTWFSRLLGACAGDLCLAFGTDGGVWLTGGVLDGLGRGGSFDEAAFLEAFDDKGRYASRQRDVPVRRVTAGDLAFRGLARITDGTCRAPGLLVGKNSIDERH